MEQWNLEGRLEPKALLIHAHPDDETIFFGGAMLSNPAWNWDVVCMTMQTEIRQREFVAAMDGFRNAGVNIANQHVLGMPDNGMPLSNASFAQWVSAAEGLDLEPPDIVFTHNPMGEYGHPHHMAANKLANLLFRNVWSSVFPGETAVGPQVMLSKVNIVELTPSILGVKNKIFVDAYGTQKGLWNSLGSIMEHQFNQGPEIFTAEKLSGVPLAYSSS